MIQDSGFEKMIFSFLNFVCVMDLFIVLIVWAFENYVSQIDKNVLIDLKFLTIKNKIQIERLFEFMFCVHNDKIYPSSQYLFPSNCFSHLIFIVFQLFPSKIEKLDGYLSLLAIAAKCKLTIYKPAFLPL